MSRHFAHTLPGRPEDEWQDLFDHLRGVGERASSSGATFGAEEWAKLAGLWHDLGKYSLNFQRYLRGASPDPHIADSAPKTDHSTAGAQHAVARFPLLGHLLAYPIAGHHSGLLDGIGEGACLDKRLRKDVEWREAPADLLEAREPKLPGFVHSAIGSRDAFSVAFFVRMLFSCLVDADFLDTEAFMRPDRASARPDWSIDTLEQMRKALDQSPLVSRPPRGRVDLARAHVRQVCIDAAVQAPGFFSLTVPTGGGKTLSSLAFALRHATCHSLDRVIYVAPFTTIIEQNADVFRSALAPRSDLVLEHHSNLDTGRETVASRLAAENWDAPLIVTTSVQFFESLFGSRTSRCRKLHRLTRAVVILDEAQTIPVELLAPTLRALRELIENYGTTVVLCTATQPAIHKRDRFPIGLEGVREIVPEPVRLYDDLRRVQIRDLGPRTDSELIERLAGHEQVLCIVNTRKHASALFEGIRRESGAFHLSALMCPEHRSQEIDRIQRALRTGAPCRLVSTQLIEAGVDIDFPVVYRSLAGLDSLAQAAGRCNRNGRAAGLGDVFVFRSEYVRSEIFFRETTNCASEVMPLFDDPLSLEAIERYFRLYYWSQGQRWDAKQVLDEFRLVGSDASLPFQFGYSTVAARYRLIEDEGKPVIIPWGERGRDLCEQLRGQREPARALLRDLQRYTVRISTRLWDRSVGRDVDLVHERYPVLVSPEISYDESTGLCLDNEAGGFLSA